MDKSVIQFFGKDNPLINLKPNVKTRTMHNVCKHFIRLILLFLIFIQVSTPLLGKDYINILKRDSTTINGKQSSVLFWRIKIKDPTKTFGKQNSGYFVPEFKVRKPEQKDTSDYVGPHLQYSSWGLKVKEGGVEQYRRSIQF